MVSETAGGWNMASERCVQCRLRKLIRQDGSIEKYEFNRIGSQNDER